MIRCLIFVLLLNLWPALRATAAGTIPAGGSAIAAVRAMAGEEHRYVLDFLVFKNLAEGALRMTVEPGGRRYRAELEAHTLGVADWLAGDRTQRYVSVMEADGSGFLRTVSFESSIGKRKRGQWNDKLRRYRFDYQAGKVYQEKGENGRFRPGKVFELPVSRRPVDLLTGFYNLRAGAYGSLAPGARLKIPTFTSKGIAEIDIAVLTGPERQSRPFFPAGGTLLKVWADPEFFDTGGADLYVWFDEAGHPARGIVENVSGLGDVYGHRREEKQEP